MQTPGGTICIAEASYTFPTSGNDLERQITAEKAFLRQVPGRGESVQIIGPDGRNETVSAPEGYVNGWPRVIKEASIGSDAGSRRRQRLVTAPGPSRLIFDAYRMAGEA